MLKGGAGIFYDRVPLMLPPFATCRAEQCRSSTRTGQRVEFHRICQRIEGGLQNPRSTSWNVELERRVTSNLALRAGYEKRDTAGDFIVSPMTSGCNPA